MRAHQAAYPIATMCRLLGLSTSGYYAWNKRAPCARSRSNAQLLERIRAIHERSGGTYGAPRVHAQLRQEGMAVGYNRVARLMREAGCAGSVVGAGYALPSVTVVHDPLLTWCAVSSLRRRPINCGWPTSPTVRLANEARRYGGQVA